LSNAFLALLLLFATDRFPPVPPLPAGSWPAAADAEPFARALVRDVPAEELAAKLLGEPNAMPAILRNLGTAVMTNDQTLRASLAVYLANVERAAATKSSDVQALVAIAVIDPLRFGDDTAFRGRVDAMLPRTIAAMPRALAEAVLDELNRSAGLDFETSESIAAAAHLISRKSSRIDFDRAKLTFPDDLSPIRASIYSLNTSFFTTDDAVRFLDAVHRASPERRLIVLGDAPMRSALAPLHVTFIDDHARPFTPWPRDPFLVAHAKESLVFINRPNAQPQREEDQNMVRAIVDELPESSHWAVSPMPFHNGNVLLTPTAVWITIHALEPRVLSILGLPRAPVETFETKAGVARYLRAVQQAVDELHAFYRKPVRFVHPMPTDDSPEQMKRLGGGAGFDLDSIVTILPKSDGTTDALVADVDLGVKLVRDTPAAEWERFRRAYELRDDVLATQIAAAQNAPEARALQQFLDDVAAQLRRDGMTVRRLPFLRLPQSLFARTDVPIPVLITWNNVVLEKRGSERRAEGFASLITSADDLARRELAASGYRLDLFPPLIRSVVLGGGYRCASNHVR